MTHPHDYQLYLQVAIDASQQGGKLIRDSFYSRTVDFNIDQKENSSDLVTIVDQTVESLITKRLAEAFPTHEFIGEETVAAKGKNELTDTPTWVLDPLDGTMNFCHGFPFVCVSLALVINKESVVAVVYNPILEELFTAIKGEGSFCNGKRLPLFPVTSLPGLASALLVTEYGSQRELLDGKIESISKIIQAPARGIRSLGSAATNLCYVAKGAIDVYWECGLHIWDMAAAVLILKEAGGIYGGFEGSEKSVHDETFDLLGRKVIGVRATPSKGEQEKIVNDIRSRLTPLTIERD